MPIEFMDHVHREWGAWQAFVKEFQSLYGDINDSKNDALISAVRMWGEHLVDLRSSQPTEQRARILKESVEVYNQKKQPVTKH